MSLKFIIDRDHPLDTLEEASRVLTVLQEAMCTGTQDAMVSEETACGANILFWAVKAGLEDLGQHLRANGLLRVVKVQRVA